MELSVFGQFSVVRDMNSKCRVCYLPFFAHNSMRRDCCERNAVHLTCVKNVDLERCPECGNDPMRGQYRLRPLKMDQSPVEENSTDANSGVVGPEESQAWVVGNEERLASWKDMLLDALNKVARRWIEMIEIRKVDVHATLSDGTQLSDCLNTPTNVPKKPQKPEQARDKVYALVSPTLEKWNGYPWQDSRTELRAFGSVLDGIVEFVISVECNQWIVRRKAQNCVDRPFLTRLVREKLGTWNCLICLTGLENATAWRRPRAERILIREGNIQS